MVFTNNRFLSPLFLTFKSLVYASLHTRCPSQQPHTLSLVLSCLCHCSCFMHFDGCVCSIAPLVASAFPFVRVHRTLHPVLCLASLCCVFRLCIFCVFFMLLLNFVTAHFIIALYHTLFRFANFILHLHLLTSAFLGTTELQWHSHFIIAWIRRFWCVGFRVLLFFLALKSV
jgi:hypothetical protein